MSPQLKMMAISNSKPLTLAQLRQTAVSLLARRDYSRLELQRKLAPKAENSHDVDSLLDELAERKWQSDDRFAQIFIRDRVSRGHGPLRVEQELRLRGIASVQISEHITEQQIDWYEQAVELAQRKFTAKSLHEPKQYAKAYRFLQQRGFSSEQINHALKSVRNAEQE